MFQMLLVFILFPRFANFYVKPAKLNCERSKAEVKFLQALFHAWLSVIV